ncbi:MBL fold metallo-hydrolase [Aquimarina addita]|uniref:MBL fold metallo-hydrolase n=1 Tax=Aquimarina addita TaxID=870485 RepID=A0ABP6UQC7_9FLAO
MKKTNLYLNYAGYCIAKKNHAIRGGNKQKIKFHALWGIIQHPEKGYILYDTGYTQKFYKATRHFPNKIYAVATKVSITPEKEVKHQLMNYGISPDEIKHIIITHFHADHVGGLTDFPNAQIYTSKKALEHTLQLSKHISFAKGVLKDLLPSDLQKRAFIIEDHCDKISTSHFDYKYDLFHDQSVYIYNMPGHAAGQIAVMVETTKNKYFLIADACWLKESYEENRLPHPIVKLFFHSWKSFKKTVSALNSFHKAHPEILIVPTHCSETTHKLVDNELNFSKL